MFVNCALAPKAQIIPLTIAVFLNVFIRLILGIVWSLYGRPLERLFRYLTSDVQTTFNDKICVCFPLIQIKLHKVPVLLNFSTGTCVNNIPVLLNVKNEVVYGVTYGSQ